MHMLWVLLRIMILMNELIGFDPRVFLNNGQAKALSIAMGDVILIQFELNQHMSELNKLVTDILNSNEHDTKNAIQQLFHLLATHPQHHHSLIQKAILFSMENLHEWTNIMKYIDKWKMDSFRTGFIARMRKRLNEEPSHIQSIDTNDQAKRLVEKYWKTRSPKKDENFYKEPIILNNIIRNTLTNSISQKLQAPEVSVTPQSITQKQPEEVLPSQESKQSHPKWKTQPQEESNVSQRERRQRNDPLASVTGRPPILKKKSIFDTVKPNHSEGSNQEKKQIQANKKTLPTSRIHNIMKRYADKEQPKSTDSWDNFGNSSKEVPKKDEDFPTDKFKFGSNKKSNEPQLTKKIPLSPRKYDPTNKIVKIIRNEPKEPYQNVGNLHQFSFASSARKEQPRPQQQAPKALPLPEVQQPQSDKFIFHDNKESDQTSQIRDHNNSFQKVPSPTETPMFMFNQSKKRRSSVNRQQESLQIDEQLKLYDPSIKLRYFMHEIQVRLKMDTLTLFQEQWSSFIRNPQAYRR